MAFQADRSVNIHFLDGSQLSVLEFLNNLWGLGTEKEKVCGTGPPGYTAWRN
jgi:hypothetical protein